MNKVQILVIEDDIAVGNLITTTLEMENYQFRLAKTAKQGIMNVLSYNPDIMLLDLGLPDMDGLEVIRRFVLGQIFQLLWFRQEVKIKIK